MRTGEDDKVVTMALTPHEEDESQEEDQTADEQPPQQPQGEAAESQEGQGEE